MVKPRTAYTEEICNNVIQLSIIQLSQRGHFGTIFTQKYSQHRLKGSPKPTLKIVPWKIKNQIAAKCAEEFGDLLFGSIGKQRLKARRPGENK